MSPISAEPQNPVAHLSSIAADLVRFEMEKLGWWGAFTRDSMRVMIREPGKCLDPLLTHGALALKALVLDRTLQDRSETVEFRAPATWWDHFKKWLGHGTVRWRVKRVRLDFKVGVSYPQADILVPREKFGQGLYYSLLRRDDSEEVV